MRRIVGRWLSGMSLTPAVDVMLVGFAACALALTLRNAWRTLSPPAPVPDAIVDDWRDYADDGQRIGPPVAPLTVIVFSDYLCEHCAHLHRQLAAFRTSHPNVPVVIRHFPLSPRALSAARAAKCAGEQSRFPAFHGLLFAVADSVRRRSLIGLAREAGVPDTSAFFDCLRSQRSAEAVQSDVADGQRLAVTVAPTILIDSARFNGIPEGLERMLRRVALQR